MTSKQLAIKAIQALPDSASIRQIKEELDFVEGIEAGFRQIQEGKTKTIEEARGAIDSWFSKSSSQN